MKTTIMTCDWASKTWSAVYLQKGIRVRMPPMTWENPVTAVAAVDVAKKLYNKMPNDITSPTTERTFIGDYDVCVSTKDIHG